MKRKNSITATFLLLALGTSFVSIAQTKGLVTPFRKGSVTVNLGVGTGTDYRGGRSAWHYGWKVSGLDTYAGLSAGAGFHHYDYNNGSRYENDDVIPVFGGFVGASYFFTPSFGVNVEAGYDITSLQAGVVFKLR